MPQFKNIIASVLSLLYGPALTSIHNYWKNHSFSLQPHGLQHARPPCPSTTPRVYPNSCQLSQWCHLTVSFSVIPFSSHLQSFPASGSFQMSQLFVSGNQSIGVSASASVLPMNTQDWSPLGWSGWISLQSKGLSRVLYITAHHSTSQLIHRSKVMSLLFNMLSRFVRAFLPRSKHLLNSWLQSPSAVIFGAQENKICHCFHFFPFYLPWSDGTGCHDLIFLNVELWAPLIVRTSQEFCENYMHNRTHIKHLVRVPLI